MNEVSTSQTNPGTSDLAHLNATAEELYYFAYGSNMNPQQMAARCPHASVVVIASLADHQIAFFGYSAIWDGAQETVLPASGHNLWGVVYQLSASDRESLDDAQDARMDGSGAYFHSPASVSSNDGTVYKVLLYKKASQGSPQKPSQEYLDFIVQGAQQRQLPSAYIQSLRQIESTKARFVVPRQRKSLREMTPGGESGRGECGQCGDAPSSIIDITLGPSSRS